MKYEYREVKCPWCGHVFMWNKDGKEGISVLLYRLRETKEFVKEAKCPKCEEKMVVLPHIFEGVDVNDKRIEAIGIRGI